MKSAHKTLAITFFLVFVIILVIFFRPFLQTNIVEPLVLVIWLIFRVIASVDQKIYWGILVFLSCYLIIRNFVVKTESSTGFAKTLPKEPVRGVEFWRSAFESATYEKENFHLLRQNMKDLLVSAVMQKEHLTNTQAQTALDDKQLPLPDSVYAFIYPPKSSGNSWGKNFNSWVAQHIPVALRRWNSGAAREHYQSINEVLQWMETYLEMKNEQ